MDKTNTISSAPVGAPSTAPGPVDQGRWVPVDQNSLGFNVPPIPNGQPVQGPDGALYCVGNSDKQLGQVGSNFNNAVPTPSSIVQMPPIVQPIALVPYTSQNQPLLQYDPYSRPVEPQAAPKAPVYIRKPYKGLSVASLLAAIIGLVCLLATTVFSFLEIGPREAFKSNGLDVILGAGKVFGAEGVKSDYATGLLKTLPSDALSKILVQAIPFLVIIVALIFVCLAIKYLGRIASAKSPRAFSVSALVNVVLTVCLAAAALIVSSKEVPAADKSANTAGFFLSGDPATIMCGIGLVIALIASIVLFILPFCAKKNAYMIERDDPSKKTYIINN